MGENPLNAGYEAMTQLDPLLRWLPAVLPQPDEQARQQALARWDASLKPRGSLGRLETLVAHLAAVQGRVPPACEKPLVLVMAGDHGVVAEGVSAYPQEVTRLMVPRFLKGGAAISVLARRIAARLRVVDMGVRGELPSLPGLYNRKIAAGTRNFRHHPAMTREQAVQALHTGFEVFLQESRAEEVHLFVPGDMGIGNTTAAAAVACALLNVEPERMVGRGAGLDDAGLQRKRAVVREALEKHRPDPQDPLDVLHKVGGFEIAGLAGAMLAAASRRVPIVLDGFIVTAAALVAVRLRPDLRPLLLAGHRSAEPGHALMLQALELEPILTLDMRLGEGSGAALAVSLLQHGCALFREMATIDQVLGQG